MLDPRTKWLTVRLLVEDERKQLWNDIKQEIVKLVENEENDSAAINKMVSCDILSQPQKKRKGAASFLAAIPEESTPIEDSIDGFISVDAEVTLELSFSEKDKGTPLQDEDGNFLCPLEWWRVNHVKFPKVWLLAQKILSIPATSAPSEKWCCKDC
jgi:hypothetical protein